MAHPTEGMYLLILCKILKPFMNYQGYLNKPKVLHCKNTRDSEMATLLCCLLGGIWIEIAFVID